MVKSSKSKCGKKEVSYLVLLIKYSPKFNDVLQYTAKCYLNKINALATLKTLVKI